MSYGSGSKGMLQNISEDDPLIKLYHYFDPDCEDRQKAERELVQVIDSLGNQGRASEILYLFVTKGFDLSLEIWRAAEIALNKAIGILAERGDVSELTGLLENKNLTGRIEKIIKRSLKSADEIRKGISLCGGGTLTRGKIKPPKRIRSERQRSPKQKV